MSDLMGNDRALFLLRQFTIHHDTFAVILVQGKTANIFETEVQPDRT
ncbi:MAG: hypothetical protein AB1796_06665 [Bacillota bacterium]